MMSELPPDPKRFVDFFVFYRNKLQVNFFLPISKNLRKTFFIGKKSDFKFQNRGFLGAKNVLEICWSFTHKFFFVFLFLAVLRKTVLIRKKSDFKFQNRGEKESKSRHVAGQALFFEGGKNHNELPPSLPTA